ncbi:MAG: hypothetical protein B6I22_11625 [Desulfobacteraceae bacterium 4572_123]|nr:MAG: hypothetical protein B6I22_11625 [Desulfobacteraceae bacterium 4572_123]
MRNINELTKNSKSPFFYGYTIIAASFFIQIIVWGIANSFGVFFAPLLNEFNWTRATLSGAASLCFLVHGFISILMGNFNDRFGPRLIMTGCGIILGTGFLLMGTINSIWHLYLFYGLVAGVGLSATDVVLLSTTARWFEKKRGMMSGIIKVGTGLGMVIMPIFITWLLNGYGWRSAFTVLGATILVSVIFFAQFLVRDPAAKAQFIDNKTDYTSANLNKTEVGLTFHEVISTRQFWIICSIYFIILFCVFTIIIHIVIWLQIASYLWMFYLFAIIYGFAHGGFFSLVSPLLARQFGTKSHGSIYGIVIFCSTLGGAIGPLTAGYIFDITHSYNIIFLLLAAMCTMALILTAFLKSIKV